MRLRWTMLYFPKIFTVLALLALAGAIFDPGGVGEQVAMWIGYLVLALCAVTLPLGLSLLVWPPRCPICGGAADLGFIRNYTPALECESCGLVNAHMLKDFAFRVDPDYFVDEDDEDESEQEDETGAVGQDRLDTPRDA